MTIREPVKGSRALARRLGVHHNTVGRWRKAGLLREATIIDTGRTIVYDLALVAECLRQNQITINLKPQPK